MDSTLAGRRVELLSCADPYTRLEPYAQGTVLFVDDVGTLHVKWDSGSTLGLVEGEDRWRIIDE
jgi:hypothetical protein